MKIIYLNGTGGVAIVYPTQEALKLLSLHEIAARSVPQDIPFWVVDDQYVPCDRKYRDAWEADEAELGQPTGYGGLF